jgi:acyl dehydratase
MTLNLAMAHTDAVMGMCDRRLVYGGQVIGIAAAHLNRVVPSLATILAWRSCDHIGPTFEGDRLATTVEVEDVTPLADGARVGFRVRCDVEHPVAGPRPVLDWRLVALVP